MTTCKGMVILFLGLLYKVSGSGDSTQVYFFKIEFDSSVEKYIKELILDSSALILDNQTVSNARISTVCTWNGTRKQCSCEEGYMWSSDACTKHKCCKTENCTLTDTDAVMCQSDKSVSISGSSTMNRNYNDLFDSNNHKTQKYEEITAAITQWLKGTFSELPWFDSLVITGFRPGSLIVDYTLQVLDPINLTQLENIAKGFGNSTTLVTKGLVTISVPKEQPIAIGSNQTINCTRQEDLGCVKWVLTDTQHKSTAITNGAEATLSNDTFTDTVHLQNISGSWKGLFTCEYTREAITHTASEMLDIALLPDIRARSYPQFPDCTGTNQNPQVTIQCVIKDSSENYSVSWTSSDFSDLRSTPSVTIGDSIFYKAAATIRCLLKKETVTVNCTFTNNRIKNNDNYQRAKTVDIHIIHSDSTVCSAEDPWPKTKKTHPAVLDCDSSAVGEKSRTCTDGQWGIPISNCVNLGVQNIHNELQILAKGLGYMIENADRLFGQLQTVTTTDKDINSYANINTIVHIMNQMNVISRHQSHQWNDTIVPNFVSTISNVLNDTQAWTQRQNVDRLSVDYLQTIEKMIKNSNLSFVDHTSMNVHLVTCNTSDCKSFNVSVNTEQNVVVVAFKNLADILPKTLNNETCDSGSTILSVTAVHDTKSDALKLNFSGILRRRNHEMYCVYWNENENKWSREGCTWGGASNPTLCNCTHNSAFSILMSKHPVDLPYMEELTYACLGVSIVSLVLCILIEILVWDTVVKSNIANFRHIALVNISAWLLLAYCAFLGTAEPKKTNSNWCLILTAVKHYCFLAVFFWTLCLSFLLLHQLIFIFEQLRKKVYLAFSITLGYVCPLVCVAVTFVHFDSGKVGKYYSIETCWLTYESGLNGSIFAFIFPVGTIVIINMFTLAVVIMKLVTPAVSEAKARDEKAVVKGIIKTIVFLSPILGITWILGFLVFWLDLTQTPYAQIVNYAFTILNSLQGFFILLTNCFGEKRVREALLKRFRGKPSVHSKSDHCSKMTSGVKNK